MTITITSPTRAMSLHPFFTAFVSTIVCLVKTRRFATRLGSLSASCQVPSRQMCLGGNKLVYFSLPDEATDARVGCHSSAVPKRPLMCARHSGGVYRSSSTLAHESTKVGEHEWEAMVHVKSTGNRLSRHSRTACRFLTSKYGIFDQT